MNTENAVLQFGRLQHTIGALVTVLLLMVLTARSNAQTPVPDPGQGGLRYVIAFPDTVVDHLDPRFPNKRARTRASLWIYSPVATKVKINGPVGALVILNLQAGETKIHELTGVANIAEYNLVTSKTWSIEADAPVFVTCFYGNSQGMEAFTPLPLEAWGTEYRTESVPGEVVRDLRTPGPTDIPYTPRPAPPVVLVIAAFDSTSVSVWPPPGMRFSGNPPTTLILNAGQAIQYVGRVDTSFEAESQDDIAESIVIASKPVAVVSGNTCAMVDQEIYGMMNNIYKNPMIEQLSPTTLHGRDYVWTPSFDEYRLRDTSALARRREFARVYYSAGRTKRSGFMLQQGGTTAIPFNIKRDTLIEFALGAAMPIFIHSDTAIQVAMHSSGAYRQDSMWFPGGSDVPYIDYSGVAPYMVDLVPVERWASFAPYYAPADADTLGAMKHYINVVTDSVHAADIVDEHGSVFPCPSRIPGTPYVWGSQRITPGVPHLLFGRNGARFTGHVYGILRGTEHYRPGGTQASLAQYNALSYGYPLASRMLIATHPDTVTIETSVAPCGELTVKARAINANPVGFASVSLDAASSTNAQIVAVNPTPIASVVGRAQVEFKIVPVDIRLRAGGSVIILDRTGHSWSIPYGYSPNIVTVSHSTIDFGTLHTGDTVRTPVVISNREDHPIVITAASFGRGGKGFSTRTLPPLPVVLGPGDSLVFDMVFSPNDTDHVYRDSLLVSFNCGSTAISVSGARIDRPSSVDVEHSDANSMSIAFDPRTDHAEISYTLPSAGPVRLAVYNSSGYRIAVLADDVESDGPHRILWNTRDVPSGQYYCRMERRDGIRTVPILVVK